MFLHHIFFITIISIFSIPSFSMSSSETAKVEEVKVAFIGDQGLNNSSKSVLKLIKSEGAELVVHQGDFDYLDRPKSWEKQINDILGKDFPYIASAGNHDVKKWFVKDGYRDILERRAKRISSVNCTGDHGINAVCIYKGMMFITSGVGSIGKNTYEYLEGVLRQSGSYTWKVCSWHKQMRAYQLGDKGNSVPWKYYSLCRRSGAIIAQGHEHSYSRTYTMKNFEKFEVADKSKTLQVGDGKSFTFTNGLGGASIRRQKLCKKKGQCPYWASIYTRDQGAKPGALFCSFNSQGVRNRAKCYFKNIRNQIIDEFDIKNLNKVREVASTDLNSEPEIIWYPTELASQEDLWPEGSERHVCL